MGQSYTEVVNIIADVCGVDAGSIGPDVNLIDDLGIDSIDFLDATYEIDRKFKIKLPVESWVEEINAGRAKTSDYFVMEKLVRSIDLLTQQAA